MKRNLNIRIVDTVFQPFQKEKKVFVRQRGSNTLYKVWIYLDGSDLPFIREVTYSLHSTFTNPNRNVVRSASNPECQLIIWTWGLFTINATILDKSNQTHNISHYLSYNNQLKGLVAEDYVWEGSDT